MSTIAPEDIQAAAEERYPRNHTVDDPFGATGEAQSDPYGDNEYIAQPAFVAGAEWAAERQQLVIDATVKHYSGLLDQANAIIAEAKEWLEHPWGEFDPTFDVLERILEKPSETALAEHDAEVVREVADVVDGCGLIREPGETDYWIGYNDAITKATEAVHAEAARIEKEAGL